MSNTAETIARTDLGRVLRQRQLSRRADLTIRCESVDAIRYRDVFEALLWASGVSGWRWLDEAGRTRESQRPLESLANLGRALAHWPWTVWREHRSIARLEKRAGSPAKLGAGRSLLFLRTDHWFNVRSGGSVGHLRGVIEGLRSLGWRPSVVSTDPLVGVPVDESCIIVPPVYGPEGNVPNLAEVIFSRVLARKVAAMWPSVSPAFIYERYSLGNYTGVLLKDWFGVPYVCEFNGSATWTERHWGKGPVFHERLIGAIEMLNLHAADLIVVVSEASRDDLVKQGMDAAKILVNPNGVDTTIYSPFAGGERVRERLGLEGKILIGFIGTFGAWHGAEVLAHAFGQLLALHPALRSRVHLLMIGDGQRLPAVRDIAEDSGVARQCTFTGAVPQSEGPGLLAACDILVSPHVPNPDGTEFFGSPTKLFEYMSTGRAIVASRLGQIGDVLSDEETALLVAPGDHGALAAALERLIGDPALRDRLGRAARAAAERDHTWTAHTARTIQRLRERCA